MRAYDRAVSRERVMLKNLIPKIFYDRLRDGLEFFVRA
ncbi:hypothetical protein J2T07_001594 [Luteibacter jiangsuensis]|uniref:Uncharacterized protein n=1 Tax=Luteibacter jiangsuensis TaxID=637577 RepID=A0ABT9SZM3_9GAMM|nr:hypothetical protein [Luteibacter jiangsuensis]